jgi:hypothetical protein
MLSRKAGREAQAIKELGDVLSACAHGADTGAGVGPGHRDRRAFSASTGRHTRCPTRGRGRAESRSRAEKGPLQAVAQRWSVRSLSYGSDSVPDSEGLYSIALLFNSQSLLSHPRCQPSFEGLQGRIESRVGLPTFPDHTTVIQCSDE